MRRARIHEIGPGIEMSIYLVKLTKQVTFLTTIDTQNREVYGMWSNYWYGTNTCSYQRKPITGPKQVHAMVEST